MKHILRLVTYGARVRAHGEYGRPVRPRDALYDYTASTTTIGVRFGQPTHTRLGSQYRLVGMVRYPDRVESRYERYIS